MEPLGAAVWQKIQEQVERCQHLIDLLPAGAASWAPPVSGMWPVNVLLGHLLECLAGFCAVLAATEPEALAHFQSLRTLQVNHACSPMEARERMGEYGSYVQEGFRVLSDAALSRRIRTVFVPEGESVLTLLLGNLEHLINHKHQLFTYLKLMGAPVGTPDLYHPRTGGSA